MGKKRKEIKIGDIEKLRRVSEDEVIETPRTLSYFAADGNYGNAAGLTVIETTHWQDHDWAILDYASDQDRPQVAKIITESYEADKQLPLEVLKGHFQQYGIELDDFLPVG